MLFQHLIAFGFVYPGESNAVPAWVLRELWRRTEAEIERPPEDARVCRVTLLSREQYLVDIECWGCTDARLHPRVAMTEDDIAIWTQATKDDGAN